jgi:hypothetical protein
MQAELDSYQYGKCYHCAMPTILDPIVSEFATQEEADSYGTWLRAKVQESLDDPRPSIPHDQAMAHIDSLMAKFEPRTA